MPSETLVKGELVDDTVVVKSSIVEEIKLVTVLPGLLVSNVELLLDPVAVRQREELGENVITAVVLLVGVAVLEIVPEILSVADTESEITVDIVITADVVAVLNTLIDEYEEKLGVNVISAVVLLVGIAELEIVPEWLSVADTETEITADIVTTADVVAVLNALIEEWEELVTELDELDDVDTDGE